MLNVVLGKVSPRQELREVYEEGSIGTAPRKNGLIDAKFTHHIIQMWNYILTWHGTAQFRKLPSKLGSFLTVIARDIFCWYI